MESGLHVPVTSLCCVFLFQMVRADLAELLEVPLNGAPYGYTPFCNDRPEMEGFRLEALFGVYCIESCM